MKFPEYDELGNMIGQGFDRGAQVLNNPGVQGLLAAGLGAASQVGKRNVGPLNTLGAAGLAGLGAYGLGRNINSRNDYNKARIEQLSQANKLEADKLVGQKEFLQDQRDITSQVNPLRQRMALLRSQETPNQVPYAPDQAPEQRFVQGQMGDTQTKLNALKQRQQNLNLDPNNPGLKEYIVGQQKRTDAQRDFEYGQNNPGFDNESSNKIRYGKWAMDILQNGTDQEKQNLGITMRAHQIVDTGGAKSKLNPIGEGLSETYPVTAKVTETPEFKADVKIAETSAVERTKNAEEIYNEYGLKGGGEIVAGNIKRLDSAMEVLKRTPNFTGPKFEFMPDAWIKTFYPDVWEAKQAVELVIQPTLKETLGAQMSEQEGVRVFDRSTALALPPEANYRKWSLLAKQVKAVHEAKMSVVRYIQKNGSMEGFIGKLPSEFEYTDKALGWDKLPGYEKAVGEMEIVIRGGANSNKGKRKPFSDKSKEERFQEFKRLNQ